MNKLKKAFLRIRCALCLGHGFKQVYDKTRSWALICPRCNRVDEVFIFEEEKRRRSANPHLPPLPEKPIIPEIGSMTLGIFKRYPRYEVVSVKEEVSRLSYFQ